MTRRHKSELGAYAEMAMMGRLVPVLSDEDLEVMLQYIIRTVKSSGTEQKIAKEAMSGAYRYNQTQKVTHLIVNTLGDMVLITLVKDEEVKTLQDLLTPNGVLAYVFNIQCPDFSELGYVFFAHKDGFIKRIG